MQSETSQAEDTRCVTASEAQGGSDQRQSEQARAPGQTWGTVSTVEEPEKVLETDGDDGCSPR